ncbi:aspartate kinase [Lentibacillus cibarius]|uniref:Aspartokinase n=1 Tax=Lentibacillus cibarius TaxID=2583219 RepID=A0A549YLA6_9BACI|nr:aspartate kinase [Lentibacillus cibarius]TRM12660.1 aspartate kinase [Lentibacillus cibarius]
MKVAKFGGTSAASGEQIKKIKSIITSDPDRKIIVVSAPGKRFEADSKVTDLLIALGNAAFANEPVDEWMEKISNRFFAISEELQIPKSVVEEIEQTIKEILSSNLPEHMKMDALKAVGEDSSAKLISAYLEISGFQAKYVNPKDAGIIVSNEPGKAKILPESLPLLADLREEDGIIVIPGFFGYTKNGQLMTFPRGGSDITGSIVAAGVKADLYENFTDVNSVYTVNPTIVQNPKEIRSLTYREMRELSYAGFSVFHDEALIPAFEEKIPVCIKNTGNPKAPGTMIVADKKPQEKCVVGIASDTGFASLYISKYLMNREVGFGRRLLQILEEEDVSFEHAPSGIDEMSVIIRETQLTPNKEETLIRRIKSELSPDMISIDHNFAMIMVVGEGMKNTIGIANKAAAALSEANVNIEMINQGSSEVSMMFGIKADKLHQAIQSLYRTYFG